MAMNCILFQLCGVIFYLLTLLFIFCFVLFVFDIFREGIIVQRMYCPIALPYLESMVKWLLVKSN